MVFFVGIESRGSDMKLSKSIFTVAALGMVAVSGASAQTSPENSGVTPNSTRSEPRTLQQIAPSFSSLPSTGLSEITPAQQTYLDLLRSRDAEAIARHLIEHAKRGDVWAMREAGAFYGGRGGLANHPEKSLYWYHQAAENGDSVSELIVGAAFARGISVERDTRLARFWLERAIQSGERETRLEAKSLLASL